ncbi:hypothetical protein SEVIR_3G178400v4 [Setaria viridis]|uniref:Protein cereblon n=1 Tax=Setaria viridis TaxID=4556 RepID=A0A4U6VAG6_SETVI|nr:protein cereblon [Setaria viridis]TKW26288.1 hypothetical protein SEVIR_3G178400v2 [Setaria viridis]
MADWDGIPERERRQMEEILQLDMEELNVEVVDEDEEEEEEEQGAGNEEDDDVDAFLRANDGDGVASTSGPFTFNTSLASLHTYLGEVDDTRGRVSLLDGGTVINLPMFYLQGVVLFPGATLPLRVIQSRLVVTIDKALRLADAPCTIGVVLMRRHSNHRHYAALVGTTAEIRQLGRLDDGSLNVVARGQQRFRLRRHWIDVDRVVWGEVQIIEEDIPLRTPRDAFAQLAACNRFNLHTSSSVISLDMSPIKQDHIDSELECDTPSPNASNHSAVDIRLSHLGSQLSDSMKSSSDEEGDLMHQRWRQKRRSMRESGASSRSDKKTNTSNEDDLCLTPLRSLPTARTRDTKRLRQYHAYSMQASQAPLSFWHRWVYEMYDSYTLARRAAELWRQIIAKPSMDDHVRKPDILSFHIGSKLPVSESVRQKLLEIDGISYRLQKEIQLLKAFNLIKCRICQSHIAKRSNMVVMSTDGPLGAYVNPHGCVHETITVSNATGLALIGNPSTVHSWFPGYSWTIASCAACESHIGWLFRATKKNLRPRSFWGIRSSQIADDAQVDQSE